MIKPNEINIIRTYDAPVADVWDAWTDPSQAEQWWGPRGWYIKSHSKDLKAGGCWDYTMYGPAGEEYHTKTKYLEVEKHKKLVYDHGGHDDRPGLFRVTVLFAERDGKTRMDMTMALPTPEAAEQTRKMIKKTGGNSTWDRLAEYVEKEKSGKEIFILNRSFKAPINVMYDMWTNPKHLAQWLPAGGCTMDLSKIDIREGGGGDYTMSGNGVIMYGRVKYLKLHRPDTVIDTLQLVDKDGNPHHPYVPNWPKTILRTIRFVEEGANQTRVTVKWEVYDDASKEEIQAFINTRGGMSQGLSGALDNLDDYLLSKAAA